MPDPFKGTKIGVVEEVPMPAPVATVNMASQGKDEVSEQKRRMLWELVESSGEEELTADEKEQLYLMLLSQAELFSEDGQPGRTSWVKHQVDTGGSPPIRQPPRRIPPYKQEEA